MAGTATGPLFAAAASSMKAGRVAPNQVACPARADTTSSAVTPHRTVATFPASCATCRRNSCHIVSVVSI